MIIEVRAETINPGSIMRLQTLISTLYRESAQENRGPVDLIDMAYFPCTCNNVGTIFINSTGSFADYHASNCHSVALRHIRENIASLRTHDSQDISLSTMIIRRQEENGGSDSVSVLID
jgi:hypothetical protein